MYLIGLSVYQGNFLHFSASHVPELVLMEVVSEVAGGGLKVKDVALGSHYRSGWILETLCTFFGLCRGCRSLSLFQFSLIFLTSREVSRLG